MKDKQKKERAAKQDEAAARHRQLDNTLERLTKVAEAALAPPPPPVFADPVPPPEYDPEHAADIDALKLVLRQMLKGQNIVTVTRALEQLADEAHEQRGPINRNPRRRRHF